MDAQSLLDELIQRGKELTDRGKALAQDTFDIPDEGEERDAMISKLTKGAAIAGTLALLLGTKTGRGVTGGLLKLGSLAAVGGIGWNIYRDWAGSKASGTPFSELSGDEANERGLLLLRSMVAAAMSDGHIKTEEKNKILELLNKLELDDNAVAAFQYEFENPASADSIATGVSSESVAAEVYITSLTVVDLNSDADRLYMDQLANALDLAPQLVTRLEEQSVA